jgi:hypothetical protein
VVIRELLGMMHNVDLGFSVCWQVSSTHLKPKVKMGSPGQEVKSYNVH